MFILEVLLSCAGVSAGLVYGLYRHGPGLLKRLQQSMVDLFLKGVLLMLGLGAAGVAAMYGSFASIPLAFHQQTARLVVPAMVVCVIVGTLSFFGSGYGLAYLVRLFEK